MTSKLSIGAASTCYNSRSWNKLPWSKIKKQVYRLQIRIAKAERTGKTGRVKALQRILTSSFYAKVLAIKRVTSNKGAKTPGVDGILWRSNLQKIQAVLSFKRRGYNPLPLRRIYITKKSNKLSLRPLSIPAMKDRAMMTLWQIALEPIAEERADPNHYGFRLKRSAKDAIEQCFKVLNRKCSAQYVFDGDIKSCFDKISHKWLLENIPMDKIILKKFLKAGFMQERNFHPTTSGVPQGGTASPTITLLALSRLEKKLKSLFSPGDKVNMVAYADDFIVTASSKELLEEKAIPTIKEFLQERGLEISQEKSKICHIANGFDFLGFNIRKYNGKLLIKPAKANVKNFLKEIKETIRSHLAIKTEELICLLNPKIRGWTNYFHNSVASSTFSYIDFDIFNAMWRWMKHRHPNQNSSWIYNKYFKISSLDRWQLFAMKRGKDGKKSLIFLFKARTVAIRRHIKIKAIAHPFNPEYKEYFKLRDATRKTRKI